MLLSMAAERFIQYITVERGYTKGTITSYSSDLKAFERFASSEDSIVNAEDVTRAVVRRYISSMAASGYKPATIARRIYGVSSMFNYLVAIEHLLRNPCFQAVLPKKRKTSPVVLSADEAGRLLAASGENDDAVYGFRDRAMLTTLLFCGLRRAELLDLRLEDVDLKAGWLKVKLGKGMKARSIPLQPNVVSALSDWFELRPACETPYVFPGLNGDAPLSPHGLHRIFRRALERSGLRREGVTIHTMRHTFATMLLQGGADIVSIQQLLGHNDLATTSIYLQVDSARLQQVVQMNPLAQYAT